MKKVFAVLLTLGLAIGSFAPVAANYSGMFLQIVVECPGGGSANACMGGSSACGEVSECSGGGQIGIK